MSTFGELLRRLRREQGLSLRIVAKKLGTQKGYLSGIENGKVNPPSAKLVKRIAGLYRQDEKSLLRLAWADKAPSLIREDAVRLASAAAVEDSTSPDLVSVRLLNPDGEPYPAEVGLDGAPRAFGNARLVLPRRRPAPEFAAIINDDAMDRDQLPTYHRGDVVLLARTDGRLTQRTLVYAIYESKEGVRAAVREAVPERSGDLVLQPYAESYPLVFLPADDVVALFRVVGKIEMFATSLTA